MAGELKRLTCDPACGFEVQSHNEQEILDFAMTHVRKIHPQMKMTIEDARKMMKVVM